MQVQKENRQEHNQTVDIPKLPKKFGFEIVIQFTIFFKLAITLNDSIEKNHKIMMNF